MACCAFIVLLLAPWLAPVREVWSRLGRRHASVNAAVEWSPYGATPSVLRGASPPSAPRRVRCALLAAAAVELALGIGVAATWLAPSATTSAQPVRAAPSARPFVLSDLHDAWCGAFDAAAARLFAASSGEIGGTRDDRNE